MSIETLEIGDLYTVNETIYKLVGTETKLDEYNELTLTYTFRKEEQPEATGTSIKEIKECAKLVLENYAPELDPGKEVNAAEAILRKWWASI